MRAVLFDQFGPPEVLHVGETAEPHAGPREVRIRVEAAGVSPVDVGVRAGSPMARARVVFPHVPGVDAAGVVDEVGSEVREVEVGDHVFGSVDVARLGGATAQLAVLQMWAIKPASLSWVEAGSAGTSVETATRVLDVLAVEPGATLLVDGAAGGVGSVLVQLAVARGATVIGSCRPENAEFVRGLGAVPVTYGRELGERVRELGVSVDAAVDVAGAGSVADMMALTQSPDRVVTIADFGAAALGVRLSMGRLAGEPDGHHGLAVAAALSTQGRFHVPIYRVFPVSAAAAAHTAAVASPRHGKIAITTQW